MKSIAVDKNVGGGLNWPYCAWAHCHQYETESTISGRDVVMILDLLPIFLHDCEIKYGRGLGMRLCPSSSNEYTMNEYIALIKYDVIFLASTSFYQTMGNQGTKVCCCVLCDNHVIQALDQDKISWHSV